ncbi:N-acetylmuramoyl-L-alanine amidase [Winogradskyella echinorum]|uniref:N-acetylmuramoyl-L-alanine amidase n=1 Tax=Winogradskyella echinorum TaxID=538189 RepID=A0ABR6Y006_9FLAO|nr:N-acetylmuramoyl-L-alanine amidase [Winogradskyella echinorum]MBC3846085.1 N-acetylmuramoyl-L-alanine amidase [Winogradskyella echinorum]MBC5750433.1 N-acetylmuramoyl-L-alanine amidase [Winogradskyella echinorum]
MRYFKYLVILLALVSCSKDIYRVSKTSYKKQAKVLGKSLKYIQPDTLNNKVITVIESQNFSLRKPNFIVIHHTDQDSCEETYRTFALKQTQVSSHYVICDDGTVTQMLNDMLRGWHAGNSSWRSVTDLNSVSIGIELDNDGEEPFSYAQINNLIWLLENLTEKYNIPKQNIIGHADVAPGRKTDPSALFPWKILAESGFGIWYDETKLDSVKLDENFNSTKALSFIGYNISNLENAIYSFKLHFNPTELSDTLTEKDKKILYLLEEELLKL